MTEHKPPKHRRRPTDLLLPDSVILRGRESAVISGCRRILQYGERKICLLVGRRRLCVMGESLICTSFCAGSVTVEGEISGIRYCDAACGEENCGEVSS